MVAGAVVVGKGEGLPACACPAAFQVPAGVVVPAVVERGELVHALRLCLVQLVKEGGLDRAAPLTAAFRGDSECLCQEVLLGVDDVHQVPQGPGGVVPEPDVDVDAAGAVCAAPGPPDGPGDLLHHLDVLPAAHRADHLGAGVGDRTVPLHRPVSAVRHGHFPVVQVVADVAGGSSEVRRDGAGSRSAANACGLNLDAESLCPHGGSSLPGAFSRPRRRPGFPAATH